MTFIEKLKNKGFNPKNEILAGLADLSPLVGLYSAFIIGLITAVLGGRHGVISGATGAIAVVIVSLVAVHGVEYLFAAVVLMGLTQVLIGVLRLGKFIRLVPHPVIFGFLNGLAIIIFMSPFAQFKAIGPDGTLQWLSGNALFIMLGLVALTMAIIRFLPRLTTAVPSSLVALLAVSALVIFGGIGTRTVGDIASIAGGLPEFHLHSVRFSWETLKIIFPYSLIMALVGLIESLLTLAVVDELTESRGRSNKECVARCT